MKPWQEQSSIRRITDRSANGNLYTYDGLNRLIQTDVDGTTHQSWDLDALGNMDSVTTDGVTDTRDHNLQNQTTEAEGNTLAFDANGNTTTDQSGKQFVYDAWNRLVTVKDSGGTTIQSYSYDAMGRRITEGTTDLYLSSQDQVLEERNGSNVTSQYVWSPVYVDAVIERDRDADTNPANGLEQRLYVTQDANWNVTGLVDTGGMVVERFAYDAYGRQTVMDVSWTVTTDAFIFVQGFQGGRYDPATGLYHFRARDYSPILGTWMQQDPAGYVDGMSLYGFVQGNPINTVDPMGLAGAPSMPVLTPGQKLVGAIGQETPFGWLIDIGLGTAAAIGWQMNMYAQYHYQQFGKPIPGLGRPNAAVVVHNEEAADANEAKSCPTEGGKAAENKPPLSRLHPDSTLTGSGNASSYNYWSQQPTQDIIDSLKPGSEEPLTVDTKGKVWQGNTRIKILQDRGVNVNNLPRVPK